MARTPGQIVEDAWNATHPGPATPAEEAAHDALLTDALIRTTQAALDRPSQGGTR
jgi:hypothetical protein